MKFIIILISLLLERWMNVGKYLNRFSWFERCTEVMRSSLAKTGLWVGFAGVVGAMYMHSLSLLLYIYYSLHHLLHHLIGYILAIAVLVYCFGPGDIYNIIQRVYNIK